MEKQFGSEIQSNVTRRINMRKLRHVLMGRKKVTKPELAQITGRIQAGTLSLRAGQQVTGTGLKSNGLSL